MERCRTPREPGYCEIESPPKEMDRTDLSKKPRAEPIENAINRREGVEETLDSLCIVGPRLVVVPKRDRIGHLIGTTVEIGRTAEPCDQFTKARMKFRHGHR